MRDVAAEELLHEPGKDGIGQSHAQHVDIDHRQHDDQPKIPQCPVSEMRLLRRELCDIGHYSGNAPLPDSARYAKAAGANRSP